MKTRESRSPRRPYEAPRLRRIKLAADEVMAKGCKMIAPTAARQGTGCLAGSCFDNGS